MKSTPIWPFGGARSFGSLAPTALGFADPEVDRRVRVHDEPDRDRFDGDPRDVALREALYSL